MKKIIKNLSFIFILALLPVTACKDYLEVSPPGELSPETTLTQKKGMTALLYGAYAHYSYLDVINGWNNVINMSETSTDVAFNTGGAENRFLALFINFQWDPSTGWLDNFIWRRHYLAIREANNVLANIDNAEDMTAAEIAMYKAEARYIRAAMYSNLYNMFGPVPLHTEPISPTVTAHKSRATDEEMRTFIETELSQSVPDLPNPGEEKSYGRATKGHALGFLTKYYLNTRQWPKVIETSGALMDLGYYELFPKYRDLFKVANEGNKEMIVVWPRKAETGFGNTYPNGAFPPGFISSPTIPEFTWTTNMNNWGTQYRLRDAFVNSFDTADVRLGLIVQTYINTKGDTVNLRKTPNNSRSLKYFDNDATLNFHGNDYAIIRYSDILLSRAEALNEVNGPTQEAVDLINLVRARANVPTYELATVGSKENLRDLILQERAWEFISEGKRREDLIRHGKFISSALDRGVNAEPHHVLFPIPQSEIDANEAIDPEDQNPGYAR